MWGIMDDGAMRQAMLYLATTGWILSLALNVSPFMRFDGYFILSDILDFPNLHERAGRTTKVWLRNTLLGFNEEYPEAFTTKKRRFLITFALLTWLYRLTVFLGIALAVYIFFFKVLGIFLMLVELAWFVARPIWSEVSVWIKRRDEIKTKNRILWALFIISLAAFLIIPWNFSVRGYAVARPARVQQVFTPFPAQVVNIAKAGETKKGELLAAFQSPDFALRSQRSLENILAIDTRLGGLIDDNSGQHHNLSLRQQLQEHIAHSKAADQEAQRLNISAQFDGLWLDVDTTVKSNVWLNNNYSVGVLVDPNSWIIDSYIEERDIDKISLNSKAKFYQQNRIKPVSATVIDIDDFATKELPYINLADKYGGSIPTYSNTENLSPSQSLYRVRLKLLDPIDGLHETNGKVHISGIKKSIIFDAGKTFVSVLLRESGF